MRSNMNRALVLIFFAAAALAADPAPPSQPKADAPTKPPQPVPVPAADLEAAIRRGVDFLVASQNADGSWGTPERTKSLNIMASVPGSHQAFQTGTTALAVAGLIDAGIDTPETRRALERGEAWLIDRLPKLRRATPMELYNVWGHGYGILALTKMHSRLPHDAERKRKIEDVIRGQFDRLARYESVDGGWGYYDFKIGAAHAATDSISFV